MAVNKVELTKHGVKRLRKRLGINAKACVRHCVKAFNLGEILADTYTQWRILQEENPDKIYIAYNGFVYVFGLNKDTALPVLVTSYRRVKGE